MTIQTAVGYIRVSTQDQATEGVSLEAQRSKIQTWCEALGYTLIGIHEDAGLSAATMNKRLGLAAALKAVARGTSLVTYSLSRLARSTRDMIDIAERIEKQGGDLVSLTEKIDTSSASGRMVFRMLAVLSEFERDITSERTKMALAMLKAKGVKLGSPDPYQGGKASSQAATVRHATYTPMLDTVGRQGTSQDICERLNAAGYRTAQGNVFHNETVVRILKRERKG